MKTNLLFDGMIFKKTQAEFGVARPAFESRWISVRSGLISKVHLLGGASTVRVGQLAFNLKH
jgi:hypothetical protein